MQQIKIEIIKKLPCKCKGVRLYLFIILAFLGAGFLAGAADFVGPETALLNTGKACVAKASWGSNA